jgi:DNA (cytosine-5)-methyltransferase 1
MALSSLEVCAGAGGQALGLEAAGYEHEALVEIDHHCCVTLKHNRPSWTVHEADLNEFSAKKYRGIDLLAGGLPCPPFSVAGKQLGERDERNLFPAALRLIDETKPKAVMIENVRGFLSPVFADYREYLRGELKKLGYIVDWRLLNASDFGVPQLRPRVAIVALKSQHSAAFAWPTPGLLPAPTVGEVLYPFMAKNGWKGARLWKQKANQIAPTIVGGSKKHGGADLGPTRAKKAWLELGVDAMGVADAPPQRDFVGTPRLTVPMVARLQGFPDDWEIMGKKTAAYRQVGNAFPPPVAQAVSASIAEALGVKKRLRKAS